MRRDGTVVFIEFKRDEDEEPTPIQWHYIRRLQKMGHRAEVVHGIARFRKLLTP